MELLEKLSNAFGAPGHEQEVKDILIEFFKEKFNLSPVEGEHVGNLTFIKEGKPGKPRIMLDAHLDEVGFHVYGYTGDGDLRVVALGGIDDRVLPAKFVLVGKEKIHGVMGLLPPHDENSDITKVAKLSSYAIDIGCKSKDEAQGLAPIGTPVAFDTTFEDWGEIVKGKSFDDRAGCWAVAKVFETQTDCTIIASFTMGEELGMMGSRYAVRKHKPNLVICLEGTSAGDTPEVDEHVVCSRMGAGPVITFEDRGVIIPKKTRLQLEKCAQTNKIPWQYKGTVTGGTNAGLMHMENGGTPCLVVAAGCRYIHSPVSLASKADLENIVKLTKAYIKTVDKEGIAL